MPTGHYVPSNAPVQTIAGQSTTATAGTSTPVQIAGIDASGTVRPLKTQADGTLVPATQTVAQAATWTVGTGPATQTIGFASTTILQVNAVNLPITQTVAVTGTIPGTVTISGANATATAFTSRPVVMAGVDSGGTVQPLLTIGNQLAVDVNNTVVVAGPSNTAQGWGTFPVQIAGCDPSSTVRAIGTTASGDVRIQGTITVGPAVQTITGGTSVATQTVAGTLTANAGSGTFTVAPTGNHTVVGQSTTGTAGGTAPVEVAGVDSNNTVRPILTSTTGQVNVLGTITVGPATQTVAGTVTSNAGSGTRTIAQAATWTVGTGPAVQTIAGGTSAATQTIVGVTATAVSFGSNNPVVVAGVDVNNTVRPIVTSTTGQVNVIGTVTVGPSTQTISGAVTVGTGPAVQTIAGGSSAATQTIVGVTATAVSFGSNNPVVVAGVDASNTVRPFVTSTTGQINVIGTITVGPSTQTVAASTGTQTISGNVGTVTTLTNGPATQTIAGTITANAGSGNHTVVGQSTTGTAGGTQPVEVAGVDVNNTVRPILTSTTGQVNVLGTITVGPATQTVAGTITANAGSGTFTVAASSGTQTVAGTITANAGSGTFTVAASSGTQTITGNIGTITNGPATQTVSSQYFDTTGSLTITSAAASTGVTVQGGGTFSFVLSKAAGTLTTVTFQTEGSADGSNWVAMPCYPVPQASSGGGNQGTGILAPTVTSLATPSTYILPTDGFRQVRINVTTLTIAATTTLTAAYTYQAQSFVMRPPVLNSPAFLSLNSTTSTTMVAAPTAPLCIYVTGLNATNTSTVATQATFTASSGASSTSHQKSWMLAGSGGGVGVPITPPWKLPAGAGLMVTLGGANQCYLGADYFIAP